MLSLCTCFQAQCLSDTEVEVRSTRRAAKRWIRRRLTLSFADLYVLVIKDDAFAFLDQFFYAGGCVCDLWSTPVSDSLPLPRNFIDTLNTSSPLAHQKVI